MQSIAILQFYVPTLHFGGLSQGLCIEDASEFGEEPPEAVRAQSVDFSQWEAETQRALHEERERKYGRLQVRTHAHCSTGSSYYLPLNIGFRVRV